MQPIRDIRDAVVEPVEDAVETLAPSTVALIRAAIEEINESAELFKSALGTGLFAGVISGANLVSDAAGLPHLTSELFNQFIPPVQFNKPVRLPSEVRLLASAPGSSGELQLLGNGDLLHMYGGWQPIA